MAIEMTHSTLWGSGTPLFGHGSPDYFAPLHICTCKLSVAAAAESAPDSDR